MRNSITYSILFFLVIGFFQSVGFAQNDRKFDENSIEKLRKNPKYQYDEYIVEDPPPPQPRRTRNWSGGFTTPSGSSGGLNTGGGTFFIIILAIIVAFFVFQFVQSGSIKLEKKKKDDFEIDDEELVKRLTISETDQLIETAIQEGDFRRAVRLLYLSSLKLMFEKGIITWEPDKTNTEYAYEIKKKKLRQAFRDNTYIYDYIWYGERPIDKPLFDKVFQSFKNMNKLVI